jgi:hypothetical protein
MSSRLGRDVWAALGELADRLAAIVPGLLVMLTLIVLGVIVGLVVRALVSRLAAAVGFDRFLERWGVTASLHRSGIFRRPSEALGRVCFWAIFVLFASVGIDALGLPGGSGVTPLLLGFLPSLFAAVLTVIVGWLIANFLSQGVLIAAVNARVPAPRLLARGVHWAVLLFALAIALTDLGIGREMVVVGFGIAFGGLVFAAALAFGLGGRHLAREILTRRFGRESSPPHERLTHL